MAESLDRRAPWLACLALATTLTGTAAAQDAAVAPVTPPAGQDRAAAQAREGLDASTRADAGAVLDAGVSAPPTAPMDAAVPPDAAVVPGARPTGAVPPAAEPAQSLEGATGLVVRTLLGLVSIVLLVWLASHPRVERVEEMLGIRQVITSGLVFVVLGWIASREPIAVLSGETLRDLTPVMHFALGWIGLAIGLQLDVRALDRLPKGTSLTVVVESVAPFLFVAVAGALLLVAFGEPWRDEDFLRHAIALGAAGAISVVALRRGGGARAADDVSARIDALDEMAGVAALALIGAFYRPTWLEWRWELPGTVWLFLTLGMGAAVGLIAFVMVRERTSRSQFLALTLGIVALGAGMAGYVFLSPVVVCFVAGAVLANLPGDSRDLLRATLERIERPMYFLLLTVAGALWDPTDWRGWALMACFVAARAAGSVAGRHLLSRAAAAGVPVLRTTGAALRPLSPVSIAIVVSLQATYVGEPIGWIVTAVIGGALVSEVLGQLQARLERREVRP